MAYAANDFKNGISWTGAANNQVIGPFTLLGGLYQLMSQSSGTNSVQLNGLCPDGSTYVAMGAAQTTTAVATYSLAPGTYEIVGGAAYSAGQGSLIKVPYGTY